MRNAIIELLNRADERKLRLIYFYAKALIGEDAEVTPVISITDADLRLSETALKHITDEERAKEHMDRLWSLLNGMVELSHLRHEEFEQVLKLVTITENAPE